MQPKSRQTSAASEGKSDGNVSKKQLFRNVRLPMRMDFNMGPDTSLHEFTLQLLMKLATPILGESLQHLQDALDRKLEGYADRLFAEFSDSHPHIDVLATWSRLKPNGPSTKFMDNPFLHADEATIRAYAELTFWGACNEGSRTRKGGINLGRLARFIGRTPEFIHDSIRPVIYPAVCGACGGKASAHSRAASVKRINHPTKVICANCGHEDVVIRRQEHTMRFERDNYEPRLRCTCNTCKQVKRTLSDEAHQAAETLALKMAVQISEWCKFNRGKVIPPHYQDLTKVPEAIDLAACAATGVFESARTIEQALNVILLERYGEATADDVNSLMEEGFEYGDLTPLNIRFGDGIHQPVELIEQALNDTQMGQLGYNWTSLQSDLASRDMERVLTACFRLAGLKWIASPFFADIEVGPREPAVVTNLLPRLDRIIDSMETQGPMPSEALRDLKLIRQFFQNL